MMSRTLIFGFILASILQFLTQINCAPFVSGVERESTAGRQLEIPNENEIPGETIPRDFGSIPSVPRQFPGFPRRGGSEGLLSSIVNFFKNMLGIGTPSVGPNGEPGVGSDGNPAQRGILGFIRRTFSGLISRFMSVLGVGNNGGQTPSINPDAAEFPYQRPRLEPLRRTN